MALTPKEPPYNGLRGGKEGEDCKGTAWNEMDCWKVSQVQDSGGSWRDWVCCRFTAGKGLKERVMGLEKHKSLEKMDS